MNLIIGVFVTVLGALRGRMRMYRRRGGVSKYKSRSLLMTRMIDMRNFEREELAS